MTIFKRRFFLFCLAMFLLLAICPSFSAASQKTDSPARSGDKFTFICLADSRSEKEDDIGVNIPALSKIAAYCAKVAPAFAIFPGDTVYGANDFERFKKQMANFVEVIQPLSDVCKIYYTLGNHELRSFEHLQHSIKMLGVPKMDSGRYSGQSYYFTHMNSCFIAIATSFYDGEDNLVSDEQLAWIKTVLEKHKNYEHIFVYGHAPAFPSGPHAMDSLDAYPENRNKFWRMLREYDVDAYFCGHEHFYQTRKINGVYQIMTGTCGAPIKKGYGGEFFHFAKLDINGPEVVMNVYDEDNNLRDTLTYKKSKVHPDYKAIDLAAAEKQLPPDAYLLDMNFTRAISLLKGDHRSEPKRAALKYIALNHADMLPQTALMAFSEKDWMTNLYTLKMLEKTMKPGYLVTKKVLEYAKGKPLHKETIQAKRLLKIWGVPVPAGVKK